MNKKVFVGMSGGVDSSVAAFLLKEQGYQVTGVTFRLWKPTDTDMTSEATTPEIRDAKEVCNRLGIPHLVIDYRKLFVQEVVEPFIEEYRSGKTPNPCVFCNQSIKFGDFYDKAKELGADYVATGHYSTIEYNEESKRWRLKRGTVREKDQSYVLYHFSQELLAMTLMPLGVLSKEEVRRIAESNGLLTETSKKDSQDICFVPDGDYAGFMRRFTGEKPSPGNFIGQDGTVLGEHKGIEHYTIGQRRGLGISLGKPAFVTHINPGKNTITLGENQELFQQVLTADQVHWMDIESLTQPMRVTARIRYAHTPAAATITPLAHGKVQVLFDEPQRAITAGQAVAFYKEEYVVGGGIIQ